MSRSSVACSTPDNACSTAMPTITPHSACFAPTSAVACSIPASVTQFNISCISVPALIGVVLVEIVAGGTIEGTKKSEGTIEGTKIGVVHLGQYGEI